MKSVLMILILMPAMALAQADKKSPFAKFLGKYQVVSKQCQAYEELCKQTDVIEINYGYYSDEKALMYATYHQGEGSSAGYPLQEFSYREADGQGWWSELTGDANSATCTDTRRNYDRPDEIDTKRMNIDAKTGEIRFVHTVVFIGKAFGTGQPVNARYVSTYVLKKFK